MAVSESLDKRSPIKAGSANNNASEKASNDECNKSGSGSRETQPDLQVLAALPSVQ